MLCFLICPHLVTLTFSHFLASLFPYDFSYIYFISSHLTIFTFCLNFLFLSFFFNFSNFFSLVLTILLPRCISDHLFPFLTFLFSSVLFFYFFLFFLFFCFFVVFLFLVNILSFFFSHTYFLQHYVYSSSFFPFSIFLF